MEQIWVSLLSVVGVLAVSVSANAVDHLPNSDAATLMCETSSLLPSSEGGDSEVVEYLEKRRDRLTRLYSIDVTEADYGLGSFDSSTGTLLLAARARVPATGGVELEEAPLIEFEVDQAAYDEISALYGAGHLRLRIYFVLRSLQDPDAPYCTAVAGPTPTPPWLLGRLVAAELRTTESAERELATRHAEAMKEVHSLYGISLSGSMRRDLIVEVRDAKRRKEGEGKKDEATAPKEQDQPVERKIEQLLFPCFLKSISKGGPSKAALVIEANFKADGSSDSMTIAVDATGFPPLGACSVEMLKHLRGPATGAAYRTKFTTYFELR